MVIDAHPAASACSAAASRSCRAASRRVLENRCAAVAYPRHGRRDCRCRPPAASSSGGADTSPGRNGHRASNTVIAAPKSVTWAVRARTPSWYWSSTARVIAPAHRDDATAVTACLRSARHTACALRSKWPIEIRRASSRRYTEPRYSPTSPSTAASPSLRCSRVRTRTPTGGAATTGSPIRRSCLPTTTILAAAPDKTAHHHAPRSLSQTNTHSCAVSGQQLQPPRFCCRTPALRTSQRAPSRGTLYPHDLDKTSRHQAARARPAHPIPAADCSQQVRRLHGSGSDIADRGCDDDTRK